MAVTLSTLAKELKKRDKAAPVQKKRGLLEQLVFAILLENAPADAAEYHFNRLEEDFVDLNELRIASRWELVDRFTQKPYVKDEEYIHPYPGRAAERITQSLQWIFDKNDGFEIDRDRLKNAAEARAFLSENPYATRFVVDFVLHFELGYGPIPFDEGARRALRVLALTKPESDEVRGLSDLSRKKAEADHFFWTLHKFGVSMKTGDENPDEEALEFLYGLDKKANQRSWLALEPCDFDKDPHELTRSILRSKNRAITKRSPVYDDDTENENDDLPGGFDEEEEEENEYAEAEGRINAEPIQEAPPQPPKGTTARPKKDDKKKGDKKVSTKTADKDGSKGGSPGGRKGSDKSAERDARRGEGSSAVKPPKQSVSEPKEEPPKPRRPLKKADDSKKTKEPKQTKGQKQTKDSKGTKPLKKTKPSQEQPAERRPSGKKASQRQEKLKAASSTAAKNAKPTKKSDAPKPAVKVSKTKEKPAAGKRQKPKSGVTDRKGPGKKGQSSSKGPVSVPVSPKKKAAKGKSKK